MGLVIDTSALIAWERNPATILTTSLKPEEELVIPAVVWAEALIGVRLATTAQRAAQRRARLEAIRRVTGVEPFSALIAEHYADIYTELSQKGRPIPQNDMAVAATARCLKFGVLVGPNDEPHFKEVPSLEVRVVWEEF